MANKIDLLVNPFTGESKNPANNSSTSKSGSSSSSSKSNDSKAKAQQTPTKNGVTDWLKIGTDAADARKSSSSSKKSSSSGQSSGSSGARIDLLTSPFTGTSLNPAAPNYGIVSRDGGSGYNKTGNKIIDAFAGARERARDIERGKTVFSDRFAPRVSPIAGFNSGTDIFGRKRDDNGVVISQLNKIKAAKNIDDINESNVVSSFIKNGKYLYPDLNNALKSPFDSARDTDTATYISEGYELTKSYLTAGGFDIKKKSDGTQQREVITYSLQQPGGGLFNVKNEEVLRGSVHYNRLLVNLMDENDQTAYFYILGRYGQEKADEFIKENNRDALDRKFVQQIRVEQGKKFAEEHPVLENLERIPMGMMSVGQFINNNILRPLVDPDSQPDTSIADYKMGFTAAEHEGNNRISNPFLRWTMNQLNDIKNIYLDMAWLGPLNLVSGSLSEAGAVGIGSASAIAGYAAKGIKALHTVGMTAQMANDIQAGQISSGTYGQNGKTFSALAQAGVQAIAFEKLLGGFNITDKVPAATGMKRFVIDVADQTLKGAYVNVLQDTLGKIADTVISGQFSEYQTYRNALIKNGMAEDEATVAAAKDVYVSSLVDSAVIGGLMGGISGIPGSVEDVISYRDAGRNYRANNIDVIGEGLTLNKNSLAYKNAVKLESRKKITDSMLGAQGFLNDIEHVNQNSFFRTVMDETGIYILSIGRNDKYDGLYQDGAVFLADDPRLARDVITKHELFHALKDRKPEAADEFISILKNKKGWGEAVEKVRKEYERRGKSYDENLLHEEVAADFSMNLFRNSKELHAAFQRIKNDPVMFDGIYQRIRRLKEKVSRNGGTVYKNDVTGIRVTMRDFETLESLYAEALFGNRNVSESRGSGSERYSLRSADDFSYSSLASRKALPITPLLDSVPFKNTKQIDRNAIINAGLADARSKNNPKNDADSVYVHNNDTGKDILISSNGLRHGLTRRSEPTALAVMNVGDIIENAILVNELIPRGDSTGGFVLMGLGADAEGNYYPTRIIFDEFNNLVTYEPLDVIYAVKAKKNRSGKPAGFTAKRVRPQKHGSFTISIADFLDIVKQNYPDTLSQDVLDTFGITRPSSDISGSVRYRLKFATDQATYGVSASKTINDFTIDFGMDSDWRSYVRDQAAEMVRNAYEAYNRGEDETGRNLLAEAGKMAADHAPRIINESRDIAAEFADHMYNAYDRARTQRILEGQDAQGLADKNEFNFSARSLLYGLRMSNNIPGTADTSSIETAMREGFRLMKNGANTEEVNSYLRPAADAILDLARNEDGSRRYSEGYSDAKDRAGMELAARLQEHFKNSQLANAETDSRVISDDMRRYYRDIETPFRAIGVKGMTEGEVKQLGRLVRDSIDKLADDKIELAELRNDINKTVSSIMYGKDRGALDYSLVTSAVTDNVLAGANEKISRSIAHNQNIINTETAEGRAESEAARNARAELDYSRDQAARLNGFANMISNPYRMSKLFENTLQNPFNAVNRAEMDARIDEFCYQAETNRDQYDKAIKELEDNGFERSITELKNKQAYDGSDTIKAMMLINYLGRIGLSDEAVDLSVILSHRLRKAGRAVQAAAAAKLMSPEGRIIKFEQDYGQAIYKTIESLFPDDRQAQRVKDGIDRAKAIDNERRMDADEKLTANFDEHRAAKEEAAGLKQELFRQSTDLADARNEAAEVNERTVELERDLDRYKYRTKARELREQAQIDDFYNHNLESGVSSDIRGRLQSVWVGNEKHRRRFFKEDDIQNYNPDSAKAFSKLSEAAKSASRERDFKLNRMRRSGLSDDEIKQAIDICGSFDDIDHELIGELILNSRLGSDARDIAVVIDEYNKRAAADDDGGVLPDDFEIDENRYYELQDELIRLDENRRKLVDEILDGEKRIDELSSELRTRNENMQRAIDGLIAYIQRGYDDVFGMNYQDIMKGGDDISDVFSAVDRYLDDQNIPHIKSSEMAMFKRYMYRIISCDTVDELIQGILKISDERGTAKQLSDRIKPLKGADGKVRYREGNLALRLRAFYEDVGIKREAEGLDSSSLDVLRDILVQQAFGAITDKMQSSTPRRWRTAHFGAQLLSVPTFIRNILAGVVTGPLEDIVTNMGAVGSRIDPIRFGNGDGPAAIPFKIPFKGFTDRVSAANSRSNQAFLETALGVDLIGRDRSALGKFSPSRRSFTALTKGGMYVGAPLERMMGYSLSVTDEWLKGYYKESEKQSYEGSGLSEEEIERIANEAADYRVFQNDTLPGTLLENIRRALNTVGFGEADERGIHEFGLGDFVTTYTLIPGAVFTRAIEYSPLGFVKALYNIGEMYHDADTRTRARIAEANLEDGRPHIGKIGRIERLGMNGADIDNVKYRNAVLSLMRPMLGTVGIIVAYKLAQLGIIVGKDTDDYDEEQYEKSKNLDTYKLNLSQLGRLIRNEDDAEKAKDGDTLIPIAWATPIHTLMGIGAEIFNKLGDLQDDSLLDMASTTMSSSADVSVDAMRDLAMWSSINGAIQNWKKTNGIGEFAVAEVSDFAFSFMPSLLRQAANASDDYQRDPYKADGMFSLFWNKVKSNIPGLRETLPTKVDTFDQSVNTSLGIKIKDFANFMLSPSRVSRYQKNALTEELDRLGRINPDIFPSDPYRLHEGEKDGQPWRFELNDHNFEEYKKMQNSMAYMAMYEFMTSEDYKLLSDRDKIKQLEQIQKDSRYAAEDMWVGRQTAASDRYILNIRDKLIDEYKHKASALVSKYQAEDYLNQKGVMVEDVIDVGYYAPLSELEKSQEINRANDGIKEFSEKLYNVTSGNWYSYDQKKRAEKREYYQRQLNYFNNLKDSIENGTHKGNYHVITGSFSSLNDDDRERVLNSIDRYPERIKLPDGLPKKDMSGNDTKVIDLTDPVINGTNFNRRISTGAVDLNFRTTDYDRSRGASGSSSRNDGAISVWEIIKNFNADKTVSIDKDDYSYSSSGSGKRQKRRYYKRRRWKRYSRRRKKYKYKGYRRGGSTYSRSYSNQKNNNRRLLPLIGSSRFGNRFGRGSSRFGNRFGASGSRFSSSFKETNENRLEPLRGGYQKG